MLLDQQGGDAETGIGPSIVAFRVESKTAECLPDRRICFMTPGVAYRTPGMIQGREALQVQFLGHGKMQCIRPPQAMLMVVLSHQGYQDTGVDVDHQ